MSDQLVHDVSPLAGRLLLALQVLADERGECTITGKELAKRAYMGTHSVWTALAQLEAAGIISRRRKQWASPNTIKLIGGGFDGERPAE